MPEPIAGTPPLSDAVPNATAVDFNIFTAGMTVDAAFANTERPIVRMVGSSTEQDLHRDTMTVTALHDMMTRAPSGLLIWLNHDYTVPDSLFGSLIEQPVITHKSGFADLHLAVEVELENPAAARTYRFIQKKRRLGCSVGCSVEDYELVDNPEKEGHPLVHITHVRPVEWSVVGVPANQRSWVENAVRGIFENALKGARRVEDAERLAPMVKGLFPSDYARLVDSLTDRDLHKFFKSVKARPTPAQRILWEPDSQKFFIASGAERRTWMELGREDHAIETVRKSVMPADGETSANTTTGTANTAANYTVRIEGGTMLVNGVPTPIIISATPPNTAAEGTVWISSDGLGGVATVTTKAGDAPLGTAEGGEMVRQDLEEKGEGKDAAKQAQEARSKHYHIAVKEGGNVTKPSAWSSVPDSEWGDPVNYRYPMPDKSHADNAASRWGDASNRSQYSSEEQAIIGRRIAARQASFGEKAEEKSVDPKVIKTDVLEDGTQVLTYSNGKVELVKSVTQPDGTIDTVTVIAKDAESEGATDLATKAGKETADGIKCMECGTMNEPDAKKCMKCGSMLTKEDAVDETAIETKASDGMKCAKCGAMNDADAKKCSECGALLTKDDAVDESAVETKDAAAEAAAPEAETPVETKAAPPAKGDDDGDGDGDDDEDGDGDDKGDGDDDQKPAPKKKPSGKDDGDAPTSDDKPAGKKAFDGTAEGDFLLKMYNDLGAKLGFDERSFETKSALALKSAEDIALLRTLAVAIDVAADQMLRELKMPDHDDEIEKSAGEGDGTLLTASGAEISARNQKKLHIAHDIIADFSGGMHCAAFVKRITTPGDEAANAEEQRQQQQGQKSGEAAAAVVTVDTAQLDEVTKQLGSIAASLADLKTKTLEVELERTTKELALARKGLEDLKLQAAELQDNIGFYGSQGLGRPTNLKRDHVQVDATKAVDFNGQQGEPAAEPTTTEEALERTKVKYVEGVGRVRVWAKGFAKSLRPTLNGDQMACMSPVAIMAYYDGDEAEVPVIASPSL